MIKDFEKTLRAKFGSAFMAVSEKEDFSFPVILQMREVRDDGTVIAALFPDMGKDIYMEITAVVPMEEQWLVTTPTDRWSFRPLPEKVKRDYIAYMKSYGFKV